MEAVSRTVQTISHNWATTCFEILRLGHLAPLGVSEIQRTTKSDVLTLFLLNRQELLNTEQACLPVKKHRKTHTRLVDGNGIKTRRLHRREAPGLKHSDDEQWGSVVNFKLRTN